MPDRGCEGTSSETLAIVETVKHLVLLGGGHAHLFVLERLARSRPTDWNITLVNPSPRQYYSGRLPDVVAGIETLESCGIDLRPWVERIGARFIEQAAVGIDTGRRRFFSQGVSIFPTMSSLWTSAGNPISRRSPRWDPVSFLSGRFPPLRHDGSRSDERRRTGRGIA